MTIRIKHPFQSLKAEGTDPNKVRASNWNAEHSAAMEGPRVAGRSASGEGAMEELMLGLPLKLDGTTIRALDDIVDKGTVGTGTVTFDLSLGRYQRLEVSGALAIAFSNPPSSGRYATMILELVNGGSATITWPGSGAMKWASGTAPTLTPSGTDILMCVTRDGGTTWRGIVCALDSK